MKNGTCQGETEENEEEESNQPVIHEQFERANGCERGGKSFSDISTAKASMSARQ